MRKKITILGGGMSSLVTAYELTSLPDWTEKYDITVYQIGWRLGGKGASGRNLAEHDRIEEHGLHVLFGFYDNALGIMRKLYTELGRQPSEPLATFEDAFKPHNFLVMMENYGGQWLPWKLDPIPNPLSPGEEGFLKPWDYAKRMIEWCIEVLHDYVLNVDKVELAEVRTALDDAKDDLAAAMHRHMGHPDMSDGQPLKEQVISSVVDVLRRHGMARPPLASTPNTDDVHPQWWLLLEAALKLAKEIFEAPAVSFLLKMAVDYLWKYSLADNTVLRRLRLIVDLFFATVRGLIEDKIVFPPHDWFSIDSYELKDWLAKYGAHPDTLASPLIMAMKDAAYHGYSPIGAGTILHAMLRMLFTYRGNILYKMQAGMGDTIFTPLYDVLKKRGVKFEFFQAVRNIELSDDKTRIARISMGRQVTLKTGTYEPLVNVKGLPCWPSEPRYDQLVQGAALKSSGFDLEDFWTPWTDVESYTLEIAPGDSVVLGIAIGAFPTIAKQLMDASPRFASMVSSVKTTQTLGVQVWLKPDLKGLGWDMTSPVVIPYVEPLDTWADMTHLLSHEDWPAGTVGNLAYLTGAMPDDEPIPPATDHDYPWRQTERVKQYTIEFLKQDLPPLWPDAVKATGQIDWDLLVAPSAVSGVARADYQYYRAPLSPSERYVLSVPGSSARRLRPEESGFKNVVLAGDWTKTALSVGCLEAASMSGIMAARALDPRVPKAKNDWLPDLTPPKPKSPTASPPFIQIDGQLMGIPPIGMDTDVYMFLLSADYGKLQAMCDQQLNLGGSTVYKPLGPFVAVYCSKLVERPYGNPIGYVPELDFGIWVPLLAGKQVGPLFIPERLVTYSPYLFVDSGLALIGGRTVFGFLKTIGQMTFPATTSDATRFSVTTQVLPHYAPDQIVEDRKLIDVYRKSFSVLDELRGVWTGAESMLDAVGDVIGGLLSGSGSVPVPTFKSVRDIIASMSVGMRMVFLKQFPEITNARRACYQAVTETDIKITGGLKGGWLPGQYAVDIYRYQSHQIVQTLGLLPVHSDSEKDTMISLAHGWASFQSVVQNGEVIWKAPIP